MTRAAPLRRCDAAMLAALSALCLVAFVSPIRTWRRRGERKEMVAASRHDSGRERRWDVARRRGNCEFQCNIDASSDLTTSTLTLLAKTGSLSRRELYGLHGYSGRSLAHRRGAAPCDLGAPLPSQSTLRWPQHHTHPQLSALAASRAVAAVPTISCRLIPHLADTRYGVTRRARGARWPCCPGADHRTSP